MKPFSIFCWSLCLALEPVFLVACPLAARAQQTSFGINLSGGREPVKIEANGMEMRDKEGIAIFAGNVSVVQGERILRAAKMIVHYNKSQNSASKPAQKASASGLGATGIEKMEVFGKVYIKAGNQIATGDRGGFDGKVNIMVLTGSKVVLTDGTNIATGCKLTAHMDTGKALLESCSSNTPRGRVSVIINSNEQN